MFKRNPEKIRKKVMNDEINHIELIEYWLNKEEKILAQNLKFVIRMKNRSLDILHRLVALRHCQINGDNIGKIRIQFDDLKKEVDDLEQDMFSSINFDKKEENLGIYTKKIIEQVRADLDSVAHTYGF